MIRYAIKNVKRRARPAPPPLGEEIKEFYADILGKELKELLDNEMVKEISLNENGEVFYKKINQINLSTETLKTNIKLKMKI